MKHFGDLYNFTYVLSCSLPYLLKLSLQLPLFLSAQGSASEGLSAQKDLIFLNKEIKHRKNEGDIREDEE